jgi:hypothetical protein
LPVETQAIILEILERLSLADATIEVTSLPPYGLGIETSRSSLDRFHRRHVTARILRARSEAGRTAKLLTEAKASEDFSGAATELMKVRLLETAAAPDANPNHLLALSRALDRLRAFEFTERRLRLAEAKSQGRTGASPSESRTPGGPSA